MITPILGGGDLLLTSKINTCESNISTLQTGLSTVNTSINNILDNLIPLYKMNTAYSIYRLTLFGFGLSGIFYFNFPNIPQGATKIHLEPINPGSTGYDAGVFRYYKDDHDTNIPAPFDIEIRYININQASCQYYTSDFIAPRSPLIFEVRNVYITIT